MPAARSETCAEPSTTNDGVGDYCCKVLVRCDIAHRVSTGSRTPPRQRCELSQLAPPMRGGMLDKRIPLEALRARTRADAVGYGVSRKALGVDDSDHFPYDSRSPRIDASFLRRVLLMPLHTRILLGLVLGATLGLSVRAWYAAGPVEGAMATASATSPLEGFATTVVEPLGRVFLRLVLMVVLPLVFSALVLGVVGLGNLSRLGRVGTTSLLYTLLLSGTSVAIGLTLVNVIRPGSGLSNEQRVTLQAGYAQGAVDAVQKASEAKPLHRILLDLLPENPLQEMTGALDGSSKGNGMLAVMCFALVFGVALSLIEASKRQFLINFFEAIFDVCMVIIDFAMWLAPFGVACLMFALTVRLGLGILWSLLWFVTTVLLGLGLQLFVIYPLVLWVFARRNPITFFRQCSSAMLTAFGTSSSNATLPTALRVAEENLKLPPEISRFVLTVGATANQNGTALYEGVVVLFLAQVFGVDLTLPQQLTVIVMSVLAGVGTAGVPGGSIPMIVVVLKAIGVPGDGIAIILGVDRLLDMCRTVLNVTGDLALATCVSAGQDDLKPISSEALE